MLQHFDPPAEQQSGPEHDHPPGIAAAAAWGAMLSPRTAPPRMTPNAAADVRNLFFIVIAESPLEWERMTSGLRS
jgi:hypothetical protein